MGLETLTLSQLLMAGGTVVAAGSQVYAGMAAEAEGESAQAMANYNAQVAEQEAKAAEQKARFDQQRQAREAARRQSALQAQLGFTGAVTTAGTPLMLLAKQASEDELENLLIGREGAIEAARARSQAGIDRMKGRIARQRGKTKATGAYMEAGSSLLTGFSKMG